MRLNFVIFSLLVLSAEFAAPCVASAEGEEPYQDKQTGLTFPKAVGNLNLVATKTFDEERLGVAIRYQHGDSMWIDAIVYNNGLSTIPSDPEAKVVQENLEGVIGDVESAAAKGFYTGLKLESRTVVGLSKREGAVKANRVLFSFGADGVRMKSCLYFLAYKNHFIKVRATWDDDAKVESEKELEGFVKWLENVIDEKKGK